MTVCLWGAGFSRCSEALRNWYKAFVSVVKRKLDRIHTPASSLRAWPHISAVTNRNKPPSVRPSQLTPSRSNFHSLATPSCSCFHSLALPIRPIRRPLWHLRRLRTPQLLPKTRSRAVERRHAVDSIRQVSRMSINLPRASDQSLINLYRTFVGTLVLPILHFLSAMYVQLRRPAPECKLQLRSPCYRLIPGFVALS